MSALCKLCKKAPTRGGIWCPLCAMVQAGARMSLTETALEAFWKCIAEHFPEGTSGDLSVSMTQTLRVAARAAVMEWCETNAPEAAVGQCSHDRDDATCNNSCSHYAHGSGQVCTQCDPDSYPGRDL